MTRLFCTAMILAAVVFAMPALASVPFPDNCDVEWITYDITNTLVIVMDPENGNITPPPPPPLHSHSYMRVTVRDQFNQGIPNVLVTLTFTDPTNQIKLRMPCQGFTSAVVGQEGRVDLYPVGGLDVQGPGGTLGVPSQWTLSCLGVNIALGNILFTSPDMNEDGLTWKVDGLDYSIFVTDWLFVGADCRSDFDGDGAVGGLDSSIFNASYLCN